VKARKARTSFCEQKEAKKLYLFSAWGVSNTARSGAKKFFGSFFQKRTPCSYFLIDSRALASVEFALCCLMLTIFLFGIINLGDFALVYGTMRHGAVGAARTAAVQTGLQIAQTGNTSDCVTHAQVMGYFNGYAGIVMPTAGGPSASAPVLHTAWTNNTAANTVSGTFVTVTVSYLWTPVGMPGGTGIPVSVAAMGMVSGTSGGQVTTCS